MLVLSSCVPSLRPPMSSLRRILPLRSRIGLGPINFYVSAPHGCHRLHLSSSGKKSDAVLQLSQTSPTIQLSSNLGFRRDPKLGLVSLLFVISMAMGSFISVAIVSIPALSSFRKLSTSMDKLSKVVSEEVPGTLSSLKLSSLEINDLTSQLKYLRQKISGKEYGDKVRGNKPRYRGGTNAIVN